MNATIQFTHKVAGVLTDATSVVLCDPASAYGVKRNDTDGVVAAANTSMSRVAAGTYEYTFVEPVAGIDYTYWVKWTYGGETHSVEYVYEAAETPVGDNEALLHNAIRARFKAQVSNAVPLVTVFDNDPTSPPQDGSRWCRFTIRRAESRRLTCGTAEYRKGGVAFAQLFGPAGEGDGNLLELAETILLAFQGQTAAGVKYKTVTVRPIGQTGNEYQVNVEIPFEADSL